MNRSTPLCLLASAALLLACAGCTFDDVDTSHSLMPAAADTFDPPTAAHEVHRMFDAEKRSAPVAELPAQF
jgi:hypothetical protein